MDLESLVRGTLLGFAIAAPVGPIGVLCIRRTLTDGPVAGIVSGLGAASADLVYGAIAALGLAALSVWLLEIQIWLKIFGGVFLCYLGLRILLSKPSNEAASVRSGSLATAYLGTFVLTLTNPLTILSFAAMIAANGESLHSGNGAIWLVLGVFLGSAGWWLLLSGIVTGMRRYVADSWLRGINLASGLLIIGFGIVALLG